VITLSIDVTLLEKARFKEVKRKDGRIAKYCELVLIDTPNGKYGDFLVKQGVTKEERANRIEMPILGNGKNLDKPSGRKPNLQPSESGFDEPPF